MSKINIDKNDSMLNEQEKTQLRERFINQYCLENGWNKENLSQVQLAEIVSHPNYKNPGLIKS